MLPDLYIHEQFVLEHRQKWLSEAQQARLVAHLPPRPSSSWQRLAARLGLALRGLGTKRQRLGQAVEPLSNTPSPIQTCIHDC